MFRLGEALEIKHGFAFKSGYFSEKSGRFVVLTPGNFRDEGGFKRKSGAEKYYDGPVPDGYILSYGDVVVAMTEQAHGLLGSSATIPADSLYLHNQRIGLVLINDPGALDMRFVYHLFNSPGVRTQLQATATGAKVRHTAPARIESVTVPVPDLVTQRHIAEILDAIDSLSDNNRRRIALLDAMAQAIYREWFVHFRYPGRENDKLVDSTRGPVPARFDVVPLSACCKINREQRRLDPDEEIVYIDISALGDRTVSLPAPIPGSDAPGRARRVLSDGDIVWSMVRPGRRAHALLVRTQANWIGSTGLAVISPNGVSPSFVFESVSTSTFSDYLVGKEQGAAYPAVRPIDFEQAQIVVPPADALRAFDDVVSPIHRLGWELAAQARAAAQLRDLLLPKLVTGVIDVAELDFDAFLKASAA